MTKKHENDTPANARGDEWIIIDGIRYVKVHMGEEASCAKCDLYTMQQETCLDNDLGCDNDMIYLRYDKLPKYSTASASVWCTARLTQVKLLKDKFDEVCDMYRRHFINHYFACDDGSEQPSWWVGDEPGTILCLDADYFFSFDTIRYCIDNNVEEKTLMEWYDYCLKCEDFGLTTPNIKAWHHGCPRYDENTFRRIASLKQELQDEIDKLNGKGGKE